jgi:hypothetical protein
MQSLGDILIDLETPKNLEKEAKIEQLTSTTDDLYELIRQLNAIL